MPSFKEPTKKNSTSSRSMDDILALLLKLHEKIRGKFRPSAKGKPDAAPGKLDVVIMVLLQEEEKAGVKKKAKPARPKPPSGGWINRLCREIEHGIHDRK